MPGRVLMNVLGATAMLASVVGTNAVYGDDPAAARLEENRGALDGLKRAIERDYSYRDLRNIDWPKRFAEFEVK